MRIFTAAIISFVFAAIASAQEASVTLAVDGRPALVLQAPVSAKIASSNAYVNIKTAKLSLYIWAAPDAKVANDAAPRVGDLIKGEFVKFKTMSVKDIALARRLRRISLDRVMRRTTRSTRATPVHSL